MPQRDAVKKYSTYFLISSVLFTSLSLATPIPSSFSKKSVIIHTILPKYQKIITSMDDNNLSTFQSLLSHTNVNIYNRHSPTLLYKAVSENKIQFVEFLISQKVNLNTKSSRYNETALHGAIRHNHINLAFYLIRRMTDMNLKNSYGDTVLHVATKKAMNSMIKLIIAKNANKRLKNNAGLTAFDIAKNRLEIDKSTLAQLEVRKKVNRLGSIKKSSTFINGRRTHEVRALDTYKTNKVKSHNGIYIGN
ncbi:ankyrin repeat domain-containing protein [Sulfurimonas sp. SAG-AH-194-I05]|nr:ankyrin repeat domain-containing protein [Sulfurimonas sp. SAG-AH-194-I05]MDF1875246.1 ankyrin repeat domain-containing protein [Sulfurimonas sp. SAG-AH-194-I05]